MLDIMRSHQHRAVLFLSDEAPLRRLIVRALASDYDAMAVSTVDDAMRLVRDGWRFEAILCDLAVPDVSGPTELLEELGRCDPEQLRRLAFLVERPGIPEMDRFLAGTRHRRIEKPVAVAALRDLIESVVHDAQPAAGP
jgi:DNA-binding NtrC family response regulator